MSSVEKNLMSVSASKLKQSDPDIQLLNGYVIRHVKAIQEKIVEAFHTVKVSALRYNGLESNYPVSMMTNREAQIYVWSNIIEQLTLNEYNAALELPNLEEGRPSPVLKIWWAKPEEIDEQKRQKDIVSQALKKKAPF
jgi:hypothetical protein